ncbi:hypothetical protein JO972_09995 [Verrucomicrobiaceae bacterium 5K15]|uniref:Uncharacterized protein n=1 Tax=Oceaniferula flava TaxID=2800421 RepID=A0AAE2SCG4_9BACT|nr:hypothetical protein [Oceaniferula flavus]MBK1855289.1 hypothetical protein [Oceaniferula flavus]MBM1136595.1 hypothetical protein [Oceaniferula flavus]
MKILQITMISALCASLACTSIEQAQAAKYLRPEPFKELFKLEKIPLQVDSMKELSKHLTVLALREHDGSAINQRATGQMLALAMRLDPANQHARHANQALLRDDGPSTSSDDALLKAKARIRFYHRWLENPQAGTDANALSKYLIDATKVLQQETANAADQADWSGVIPPLAKYQGSAAPTETPTPPTTPTAANSDTPTAPGTPVAPPSTPQNTEPSYPISTMTINMPLTVEQHSVFRDPKDALKEKPKITTTYRISPITIQIQPNQDPNYFDLKIASKINPKNTDAAGLKKALNTLKTNKVPAAGAQVNITFGPLTYSHKNGAAGMAAVRLMLEACHRNIPLRDDIFLCASLDSEGQFRLPPNFWTVLNALRSEKSKRGRLIVPESAIRPLIQLLVFDEPDFFTRWEIYTCNTIDEALAVAAKKTDEKIAEASQLFQPVHQLSDKAEVVKLAVNSTVRKRLSDVVALAPNHLSAKILLLQGSGKRPMRLNETGLAFHLQPLVNQMTYTLLNAVDLDHPSTATLKKLHVDARKVLDPMERLVTRRDEGLYHDTMELANDIRSLNLLIRRNIRDANNSDSRIKSMIMSLRKDVIALETKVNKKVDSIAGKQQP